MSDQKTSEAQRQFVRALREAIKRYGSQESLAAAAGVSQPTISDWLSFKKSGRQSTKEILARTAGYSYLEFLDLGRRLLAGEPGSPGRQREEPVMLVSVGNESQREFLGERTDLYRGIPLYESGRLAAGVNGLAFDPNEPPASTVVVYRPELRGRASHDLAGLRVGGDSMEPTIPRDSLVLVDLTDKTFQPGRLYVVNFPEGGENTGIVKRVYRWARGFTLVSDNSGHYPPVPTEMDWHELCLGRVIWMWRNMEDM